jgi:hypothetical protein
MAILFSNSSYIRSHGKAPRGFGVWGFGISMKSYYLLLSAESAATPSINLWFNDGEPIAFVRGARPLTEAKAIIRGLLSAAAPKGATLFLEVAP